MSVAMKMRCCDGLALSLVIAVVLHLAMAAGRTEEPWPMLLSGEPTSIEPGVALLHQRANGALERLVQSGRAAERPL